MKKLIQQAIADRQVLSLTYDSKPRLVEPHTLGITSKGSLALRCYQVDGESATSPRSWKLLIVDKIEDAVLSNITSQAPRAGYRPGDTAFSEIISELKLEELVA